MALVWIKIFVTFSNVGSVKNWSLTDIKSEGKQV